MENHETSKKKKIFFVFRPMSDLEFANAFSKCFDFLISSGHFFNSGKRLLEQLDKSGGWKEYVGTDRTFFADSGAQQIMFQKLSYHEFLKKVDEVYHLYEILKPDYAASLDYPIDTHLCKTDLYSGPLVGKRLEVEEIERRIDLSLKSAERLLDRADGFTAVPVIQGDPERPRSFEYMAEILTSQSDHVGIGSLCMSKPRQVLCCVKHLAPLLKGCSVHIFGVGSIRLTCKLFELPFIYSVDTASYRYAADWRKLLLPTGIYGHKHASELFGEWVSEPTIGPRILAFCYAFEIQVAAGLRERNPLESYKMKKKNIRKQRGRPRISPTLIVKIFNLRKKGYTLRQIATTVRISVSTVWRVLNYQNFVFTEEAIP